MELTSRLLLNTYNIISASFLVIYVHMILVEKGASYIATSLIDSWFDLWNINIIEYRILVICFSRGLRPVEKHLTLMGQNSPYARKVKLWNMWVQYLTGGSHIKSMRKG